MTRRARPPGNPERASAYELCSLRAAIPGPTRSIAARCELAAAAATLPRGPIGRLTRLVRASRGARARAQHYVTTFDLHKRTGLYVTFYSHGDRRERRTRSSV